MIAQLPTLTADDLLQHRDQRRFELVHGQLVERGGGMESARVAAFIVRLLLNWAIQGKGDVFTSDNGYRCFADEPQKVRRPDVSYIRASRFSNVPTGWFEIAPDLTVEVISTTDVQRSLAEKAGEYLQAGVLLVWVVDPLLDEVHVYRPQGPREVLHGDDVLRDEAVLSGFSCRACELFGAA